MDRKIITTIPFLLLFLFLITPAYAIPTLQLDITGGIYDPTTQTTVSTSPFDLIALLSGSRDYNKTGVPGSEFLGDDFLISLAIIPKVNVPGGDYGSFSIDGATIAVTSDMVFGTPPIELLLSATTDPGDLASHGIFETYFTEISFKFDPLLYVDSYDVQTDTPGPPKDVLFQMTFALDTSSLAEGYEIHFDLYNTKLIDQDIDIDFFAPFSHDAESGGDGNGGGGGGAVPEPGTLVLLGFGLLSLAGVARKKRSQ